MILGDFTYLEICQPIMKELSLLIGRWTMTNRVFVLETNEIEFHRQKWWTGLANGVRQEERSPKQIVDTMGNFLSTLR